MSKFASKIRHFVKRYVATSWYHDNNDINKEVYDKFNTFCFGDTMSTTELVNVYSRIFILTLTSLCFSVVLLICGFLSIHFQSRFYFVGHAIWGAMFYILSSYSAFLAVRCKVMKKMLVTYSRLAKNSLLKVVWHFRRNSPTTSIHISV